MSNKIISLSMITFFYNEEKDLPEYMDIVTSKFQKMSKELNFDYEIVMVDDGSTDESKTIVEKYISDNKNFDIKLISYEKNKGIGNAIVEAIKIVKNDYIFWNDVDLHFNIEDLDKIIQSLDKKNIVVTYKENLKSKTPIPFIVSRCNYFLLKFLFYWKIKDFQFIQFYPRKFITNQKIISRSSLIPCELLTRSKKEKYNIVHIPLFYHSAPELRESKCLNLKNIYYTFRDIIKVRFNLWVN